MIHTCAFRMGSIGTKIGDLEWLWMA